MDGHMEALIVEGGPAVVTCSLVVLTAVLIYAVALLARRDRYERQRRALARARGRER